MESTEQKVSSIYALSAYVMTMKDGCPDVPDFNDFGKVSGHKHDLGIFSSVENAEQMIREWIANNSKHKEEWRDVPVFFEVVERKLDEGFVGEFNEVCLFKTVRTYLGNGDFWCMSDCDFACEVKFRGRKDSVKLKAGDFALVRDGNSGFCVCLIDGVPFTADEWKKRFDPNAEGDFTDDSYTVVMVDNGHEHPFAPGVFPMRWDIPNALKAKLEHELKEYKAGNIL